MNTDRKAVSTTIAAVSIIVVLVVAGAAGYYIGISGAPSAVSTSVVTSTVQGTGSGGSTVTVTAAGGGATTVTTTVSGNGGTSNATQTLVDACKGEGAGMNLYSTFSPTSWTPINNALLRTFPWLNINFVAISGSGALYTKALAEFQSGHVQADLYTVSLPTIIRLQQAGAVTPYFNYEANLMNYSSSYIDPANNWSPAYQLLIVITYNKNLVTNPATLPKSYTDLTNAQWKGKIAFNNPNQLSAASLLFASMEPSMGNATWTTFLQNLKANNPILTTDSGSTYQDVATGQAAIGVQLLDDFINGNQSQVGLDIIPGAPVYTSLVVSALPKGAPHPHCGELLDQWFSSYAGQLAMVSSGRAPAFQPLLAGFVGPYIPTNVQLVVGASNAPTFFTNPNGWAGYYTSIFGT